MALVFLFGVSLAVADEVPEVLEISAAFFKAEDKPEFALPGFDASDWERVSLPGSWQETGMATYGETAWYRLSVRIPKEWQGKSLSFSAGYLGNSADVYWNGTRIGGKGNVSEKLGMEWSGKLSLFPVKAPIHYGRENVIAVRVFHFFGEGGILETAPSVGKTSILQSRQLVAHRVPTFWLTGQVFLYALGVLIALSVLMIAPNNASHWCFLGVVVGESVMRYYNAYLLLAETEFSPIVYRVAVQAYWSLYAASVLLLAQLLFAGKTTRKSRTIFVLLLVTGAGTAWITQPVLSVVFSSLVVILNLMVVVWVGVIFLRAAKNGERGAGFCTLVWGLILLSYVPDTLNYAYPLLSEPGRWTPPSSWTGLFLILTYSALLIEKLASFKIRARKLSGYVFAAKEEERSRVARELHDGLARELFTSRKKFEAAPSEVSPGEVVSLFTEAEKGVREAAHGLHPSSLSGNSLADACRNFGDRIGSEDFSVELNIVSANIPPGIEHELFRIFQEFTCNSLEHGRADTVTAGLQKRGSNFIFSLEDNGGGFDVDHSQRSGLGLISIEERVRKLQGKAEWTRKRKGMRLEIVIADH